MFSQAPATEQKPKIPKGGMHNRYEGLDSAWQSHETIDDFLTRLPVHGSSWAGPWLWCANPYADRNAEPEVRDAKFMQLAPRLLEDYLDKMRQLTEENPGSPAGTITRKLGPARSKLKDDILALAKEHGMLSGKWMLFPNDHDAAKVWKTVATAVIEGKLGNAAKIATDDEGKGARLICIYTKDFSDEADVKRVVQELKKLGLLPADETKSIYYKCDAYTYLDITASNEYKLQASLYSSKDVLQGKTSAAKETADAPKPSATRAEVGQKRLAYFAATQSKAAGKRKKA
jgi:hypothetical protein